VASWSTAIAPVLVTGRGVRPEDINPAACAAAGIPIVHRRSGGGPVLWDAGLLSLDVVLPPGHPLADRDVTRAYAWLGTAVATALTHLGIPATAIPLAEARIAQARSDPTSRLAVRACFGGISPFEVVAPDLRKLVGLAQVRRARGTVFQCGIPLGFDAPLLAALLARDAVELPLLADALGQRVVALGDLSPGLTASQIIAAVEQALTAAHGIRFDVDDLRDDERAAQAALTTTLLGGPAPRTG